MTIRRKVISLVPIPKFARVRGRLGANFGIEGHWQLVTLVPVRTRSSPSNGRHDVSELRVRGTRMRIVYALVLIAGLGAVIVDHLTSPSSARAVSPEDFAGACAPCGAPCPSAQKK